MLDKCRSSLLLAFAILAMLSFAAAASAQDCDQCDPYTSHCNDYCDRCTHYGIDGCTTSVADTCGGSHNLRQPESHRVQRDGNREVHRGEQPDAAARQRSANTLHGRRRRGFFSKARLPIIDATSS